MRRNGFSRLVPILLVLLILAAVAVWFFLPGRGWQTTPAAGPEMTITVLDVGQADSIFVRAPSGKTMLVDSGNNKADAEKVILPYLKSKGISTLDYLVLTHPDQDHVGGMPDIIDNVTTAAFVDSAQPRQTNQTYLQTLQKVQAKGIKAIKARRGGSEINLGPEIQLQILGPEEPLITNAESNTNANAVVLRITYGAVSTLLAADVEQEAEARILSRKESIRSQILKVGHHGSRGSSSNDFLDAVTPEIGMISVGTGNSFGHPAKQALDRLESHKVKLYRTDQNGSITVSLDGNGYKVTVDKQGK